jgi:single stranded DNA-binding protein
MNHFNQVFVAGKLIHDPEFKQQGELSICTFPIEITETYKKRTGEVKVTTTRINIDCFGALADNCNSYLQVGMPCMVQGHLRYESWKDESGATKSRHKIQAENVLFLGEAEYVAVQKPQAEPIAEKMKTSYQQPRAQAPVQQQRPPYRGNTF